MMRWLRGFSERWKLAHDRATDVGMTDKQALRMVRHLLGQRLWRLRIVRLAAPVFRRRAHAHLEAAQAGDMCAQYNYALDRRNAGDHKVALVWFSAAAEQGLAMAMVNAARLLEPTDLDRALSWYERAAAAEDPIGAYNSAVLHRRAGREPLAQEYYRLAHRLGHPHAALHVTGASPGGGD